MGDMPEQFRVMNTPDKVGERLLHPGTGYVGGEQTTKPIAAQIFTLARSLLD